MTIVLRIVAWIFVLIAGTLALASQADARSTQSGAPILKGATLDPSTRLPELGR